MKNSVFPIFVLILSLLPVLGEKKERTISVKEKKDFIILYSLPEATDEKDPQKEGYDKKTANSQPMSEKLRKIINRSRNAYTSSKSLRCIPQYDKYVEFYYNGNITGMYMGSACKILKISGQNKFLDYSRWTKEWNEVLEYMHSINQGVNE